MKNKEIEELLNKLYKLPIHDEYQCEFGTAILEIKEIKLLLSYIEQLEKRNKELYEGFMATQEELTDYAIKNEQLENNRNEAVREIMHMIEEGNITFFKGKKLEDILMGDNK